MGKQLKQLINVINTPLKGLYELRSGEFSSNYKILVRGNEDINKNKLYLADPSEVFSSGGYIEVTHAELLSLISNSGLTNGSKYLITDFATVYDQPDFESNGDPKASVVTKTAAGERLLATATSSNTISSVVQSLDFPNDKLIRYDPQWTATELMAAPAKGRIVERIDDRDKRTDYDHRKVLYKRYQEWVSIGPVTITGTNVVSGVKEFFQQVDVGETIKINNVNFTVATVVDTPTGLYEKITVTSNGTSLSGTFDCKISRYTSWKDNGNASHEVFTFNENTYSFDSVIKDFAFVAPLKGYSFILPNIVYMGVTTANRIGDDCSNHTYYGFQTNWIIGDSVRDFTVIGESSYNYLAFDSFGVLITGGTEQNSIWGSIQNTVMRCRFDNNIQYGLISNSTLGADNRYGVYYGTNDGVTTGQHNLKCKFWDAKNLVVGSNNMNIDFGGTKNITASNTISNIKNVIFSGGIDGAAWTNFITVALHPEMYTTYKKDVLLASDGSVYTKYFNGTADVFTLVD